MALILQVSIPLRDVTAETADFKVRLGAGHCADMEEQRILSDTVFPVCSAE